MKYYIFCFLLTSTAFTYTLGATLRTQDEEKKIQDRKKSLILIHEDIKYFLPLCVYSGNENSLIYATPDSKNAIGFCPSEKKLPGKFENCLIPSKIDSCKNPAEPFIIPDLGERGEQLYCAHGKGKLYLFVFQENLKASDQTIQYIVPPEDMAFQIWKRSVYHFINIKLVLKKTAKLLDHINTQIRQKAIDRLGEVHIVDGFQTTYPANVKIWWKVVYSEFDYYAIAVIVHNTKNPPSQKEKICTENICEKHWKGLIPDNMASHAYCCQSDDLAKNNELPVAKMILNPDAWWKKFFKSQHHFLHWFC